MTTFYSAKTGGFYPAEDRSAYEQAGTWPDDGVEIALDDRDALLAGQASGQRIVADEVGRPVLAPPPAIPYGQSKSEYLAAVRAIREQILNRLVGIGMAALLGADTTLAQAVATARQALLNITTAQAVLAATDVDGLKAAVRDTFRAIVAAAPAALVRAFDAEGL
ncbi:hypothetical protein [Janthinobacterium sp.]|uniref:hypothetical protein n=1 Tax=Janthinobacterium sp. TaxID=1871054 RepID=UPI00293D4F77|nr:hypothetical protein [Janthinobacterium sp.]